MIGGNTAAKTDGEIVRHPVFYLHRPLICCRAGLRFFGPRPDLLRVRRRYTKVISRYIDTPSDNNALVEFARVGQRYVALVCACLSFIAGCTCMDRRAS